MKVKGKIIRDARTLKGFSQDSVAEGLGISQSQYSKLENGEAVFDVEKLGKLIDMLDLNPLDVIEFTDKQWVFINSSCSGNFINSTVNNHDTDFIRKLIREELAKT